MGKEEHPELEFASYPGVFRLALLKDVWGKLQRANVKARAKLDAIFRLYCQHGAEGFKPDKFKFEARVSVEGVNVPVFVFKAWQVRVYGAQIDLDGHQTFVGTEIDLKKKQDKANQAMLRRAAHKLLPYAKKGK